MLASRNIPDSDGLIVGGGGDEAGVGGEGDVGDALVVAGKFMGEGKRGFAGAGVGPSAASLVTGGGSQEAAIAGEFDGGDGALVTG